MNTQTKYYTENVIKARRYLIASLLLAAAGAVYEFFSHGVYSNHMIYAFAYPLVMGCLPYLADSRGIIKKAGPVGETLLLAAIATLSIGSVIKGVLEIYGTTSFLTGVYPVLGALLLIGAVAVYFANSALSKATGDATSQILES